MAKTFEVEIEAPKDLVAGEKFTVEVEVPTAPRKPRGQLAGLTLEEMTDEQLKRELINANSVLYKAVQRGAAEETIAKNQARVDAAKAEKEKRGIGAKAAVDADTAELAAALEGDSVYAEDEAGDVEVSDEI